MPRFLHSLIVTTLAVGSFSLVLPGLAAQQPSASGEGMTVHPEARKAIDGLLSPYCPGLMLQVCPSPAAATLRDSLQQRAVRGVESDALIQGVVDEYGEEWRAEPQRSGAGLWAWLAPPLALLVGFAVVGWVLARRSRGRIEDAPEPLDAADQDRIRRAMRELDDTEEPAF